MKIRYELEKDGKKWIFVFKEEDKEKLELFLRLGFVIVKQEQWIRKEE